MNPELDRLLEGLQREGELDSSGDFTLDFQKARLKLGRHQLVSPGHYLLKFVQACVAGGATRVHVRTRGHQVELQSNPEFPLQELPRLSAYLLYSNSLTEPRSLRHLAVGLNSAIGLEPRRLELAFEGIRWTPEREWEERPPGPGKDGSTFRLRLRKRQLGWPLMTMDLALQMAGTVATSHIPRIPSEVHALLNPEDLALSAACRFAPIPVFLNGGLCNRPNYPGTGGLWPPPSRPDAGGMLILEYTFLAGDEPACQLVGLPAVGRARIRRFMHIPSLHSLPTPGLPALSGAVQARTLPGTRGRVLMCHGRLAVEQGLQGPARLLFVRDGVSLAPQDVDLGLPGVVGVLSAHGLATDLSEFTLVDNREYQALLGRLKPQAWQMAEDLRVQLERLSWLDRLTWANRLLDRLRKLPRY
ncbi:MAG: hypothetical protein AB1758_12720 [Candidatus Eremiobacterota bacterium]